jgi:hypothetical protein
LYAVPCRWTWTVNLQVQMHKIYGQYFHDSFVFIERLFSRPSSLKISTNFSLKLNNIFKFTLISER